jgi:uncharacterized OsmC-like protein
MTTTQTTTQTHLNGIDTEALAGFIGEVSADAAKGRAKFQVATRWSGGTRSETRVESWELGGKKLPRNFTIATDEPEELCGKGLAPNPQEVLMAGLNACMTVGYIAICALKGIRVDSLSIETEGELDLRGFLGTDDTIDPGYPEIRYTVRIKGDATPAQFEEVHKAAMETSPNFFNLSRPIPLRPRLIVG